MAATRTVSISCPSGIRLSGVVHRPDKGVPDTCAVVAHGMLSSKDSDKHRSSCEAAAAVGESAVRFDFRGRGESEGDPSILTVSNEIEDLVANNVACLRTPPSIQSVASAVRRVVPLATRSGRDLNWTAGPADSQYSSPL